MLCHSFYMNPNITPFVGERGIEVIQVSQFSMARVEGKDFDTLDTGNGFGIIRRFVRADFRPQIGYVWYIRDNHGTAVLWCADWDSSD